MAVTLHTQLTGGYGSVPGGGHPASRDHVRADQLLGPAGHGLHCLSADIRRGVHLNAKGGPEHGLPRVYGPVWEV